MAKLPDTENSSNYHDIEKMTTKEILSMINKEDRTVAERVARALPQIEALVDLAYLKMNEGGRLFYIGSGTSGRLGIVDASECPPTFGVPHDLVIGVIAGGDGAIRKAVEFAEDDTSQAWSDLLAYKIDAKDVLVGIAASGSTPYVLGGVEKAKSLGVLTGCIVCSLDSPLSKAVDLPVEVPVGPEFITGSTRMKSGTAQKLVLNMISTSLMIRLGRIKDNRMVDMQLSNKKLEKRGARMIAEELEIPEAEASELLKEYGSVRAALQAREI
ncbi:MAG: N-acetylmuramic acid 6-phosphate etherase [Marinoscillum sp.]